VEHSAPGLAQSEAVSITFEKQKNDHLDETITMYRTADPLLCPVKAWAAIIQRILSYHNSTPDTPVNTVWLPTPIKSRTFDRPGKFYLLSGNDMILVIRAAAAEIGSARLGFEPDELGTHSIRSGAAMAMHLDGVPVYTIMLIGRWSSDAFLRYLRIQVLQFTMQISSRMIKHQHFYSVPTLNPFSSPTDPQQIARANPFASSRSVGCNANSSTHLLPRNPFNIHT
jgi:hypothetical protein